MTLVNLQLIVSLIRPAHNAPKNYQIIAIIVMIVWIVRGAQTAWNGAMNARIAEIVKIAQNAILIDVAAARFAMNVPTVPTAKGLVVHARIVQIVQVVHRVYQWHATCVSFVISAKCAKDVKIPAETARIVMIAQHVQNAKVFP